MNDAEPQPKSTEPVPGERYTHFPVTTVYMSSGLTRSLARLIDLALETNAPTIRSGSERVGLREFADACRIAYTNEPDKRTE